MKRSGPPALVPKEFTSEAEIDRAIRKLQRRAEQVRALGPAEVSYDDASVKAAESDINSTIVEIFGAESPEFRDLGHVHIWKGPMGMNMAPRAIQSSFEAGIPHVAARLDALVARLSEQKMDLPDVAPAATKAEAPRKVFIGHGGSSDWLALNDFLNKRLGLETEEFNRESPAGLSHKERLLQMLRSTSFAFLVMTSEDEHADGTRHARENVVHEIGLFQGRHGFEKAIVLVEEGCAQFSNIDGLNQIRYPKGDLMARSEAIRQVLEREGLL